MWAFSLWGASAVLFSAEATFKNSKSNPPYISGALLKHRRSPPQTPWVRTPFDTTRRRHVHNTHDSFLTYVSQCKGLSATSFVLHFFIGSCTQATHHIRLKCSHQGSICLQRLREHNFQPCTLVRFGSTVIRRAWKRMQTPCAKCCRKLRRLGTNCAARPLLLHRR